MNYIYDLSFIDTPEWDQIVQMAQEILKTFDYKYDTTNITDSSELELIMNKKLKNDT